MFQIFKKADNRSVFILLLVVVAISISTLTRIALLIKSSASVDFTVLNVLGIFFLGFAYDLLNTAFAIIPIVLYCWMVPGKFFLKKWHKYILFGIFFVFTFLALFNAIAEWFFWDEFNTRFNFIAVDYLVYTNEVIGNIRQSYPIEWIIVAIGLVAIAITFLVQGKINQVHQNESLPLKQRSKMVIVYSVCLVIAGFFVTHKHHRFSENAYVNELAGNGLFELFAAYRNNELNYGQFYAGIDNERAFSLVHQMIQTPESSFTPAASQGIERKITNEAGEKKLNVVLISVESFSADFMAAFGNKKGITPFLDSLAQHSLLFTNLYATGTRTVRGLEALSLCVPPTPGQSIVRRPNNENLFSLGKVFREKGYESKYIYGGYGYFDNMNYFFGNNGYTVVDRSAINDEDIDYENVWGVADENLFELALSEIDKSQNTNVFAHIMTTSNHRPYTYPEGRIDIPSHTSRQGAVKYTDYSIGKFIKDASGKSWFRNTVFVIVADHCASSAGKTELPINKYHIPMLIYSPGNIMPGKMDRLMSQIDVGPTLLGLLNFSYTSKFYGYDIFRLEPGRERAFISTYQSLGYIKGDRLVILSPQLKVETFLVSGKEQTKTENDQQLVDEAIAWYQTASYSFANGLMK